MTLPGFAGVTDQQGRPHSAFAISATFVIPAPVVIPASLVIPAKAGIHG